MPISLPNAVVGQVVTRFPPEPSWLLDLGHCKASLMNQYIATQFQGKWILRFDDTNPKTCSRQNVDAYMQDLPLLDLHPARITFASDYFEEMIDTATGLIQAGFMYADDTPTEEMRAQRMAKQASAQRDRSPADSLAAWAEMQAGSEAGQRFCLRFKLDPGSENGALRDPVAWRGIDTPHYKTGTRFRVYPTYDFAAPWLDLAEGVTHALRTLEFRDRDELYSTVQQAILRLHPQWVPSNIWEFPRIHMSYTPQAKVHQKALLAAGRVEGPTDPRLPTLRGLLRAGCHPDALKAFLLEQVSPARKETYHSWDKLWTLNRRLMDPTAARHMAVADEGRVLLTVLDGPEEPCECVVQWKQGHVVRVVPYRQVWIDQEDAQALAEGDEITLLAWGNAIIQSVTRVEAQQQQQQQLDEQQLDQQQLGKQQEPQQQQQQQQQAPSHQQDQQQQQQQQQLQKQQQPAAVEAAGVADAAVHVRLDQQQHTGALSKHGLQPISLLKALGVPTQSAAAAAVAAGTGDQAESETAAKAAVFGRFGNVLALRDELQLQQQYGSTPWARVSSSCARTAGSTSVAAMNSLASDFDLQGAVQPAAAEGTGVGSPASPQLQLQHDQQQQTQALSAGRDQQQRPQVSAGREQQRQRRANGSRRPSSSGSNAGAAPAPAAPVSSMTAVLNPGGNPKASKLKLHWLPNLPGQLLPLRLVRFGHPVLVEKVTEDVDVLEQFNPDSRVESLAWGDPSLLLSARRGNVVQLQRKGFFIVDQVKLKPGVLEGTAAHGAGNNQGVLVPVGAEAAAAAADGTGVDAKHQHDIKDCVMFYIPDGHTKSMRL